MFDFANEFLVFSNIILLASVAQAIWTGHWWKRTAQRQASTIENYQREVSDIKDKNRRLSEAVNALSREDE